MVRTRDSCPRDCGFKSRRILDGCKQFASYYIERKIEIKLGAIQKIHDTVGGGGVSQSVTKYHMGGGGVSNNVTRQIFVFFLKTLFTCFNLL